MDCWANIRILIEMFHSLYVVKYTSIDHCITPLTNTGSYIIIVIIIIVSNSLILLFFSLHLSVPCY